MTKQKSKNEPDTLKEYRRKRKSESSPEPALNAVAHAFVVQKHAASHLHYDFRIEVNGVLKSWAVPKGIPTDPSEKHLAIMVEDHPVEYLHFEGIIPKGNYGAGTVMVWDTGSYYPVNSTSIINGLKKGEITFLLKGKKLHGVFSLVKFKNSDKNWLFIKHKDDMGNKKYSDRSVLTDKTMDQIAGKKTRKSTLPKKIPPMLATLVDTPFDDPDWLFEIKWDGFRAIAELDNKKISLYSRNFKPFNSTFESVVEALKALPIQSAVFDGELVVLDDKGISHFQDIQGYAKTGIGDLRYYIFDLLYCEGRDLRTLPLIERKKLLDTVLKTDPTSVLQKCDHIMEKGVKFFEVAKKEGLEGIMAKEIHSPYQSKRSSDWRKIKVHSTQEAVICGFTKPRGSRKNFGSLILGVKEKGKWRFIGHVGTGFDEKKLSHIKASLTALVTEKCPFPTIPKTNMPVTWVQPKLTCLVSFSETTNDGMLRHPVFMNLHEEALGTHLDKVFFPKEHITKDDLLHYYELMAPHILPYLKDRPIVLLRYPNGIQKPGFFQKNADTHFPDWVPTTTVTHHDKKIKYLLIPDVKTLLFAVNLGSIDLHPFSARVGHLENPDYLMMDLDPVDIPFEKVVETALVMHKLLETHGIPSYCKTSGGRGLHLYIPLGAKYKQEQVNKFARLIAELTHEQLPEITSLERLPKNRKHKVYLDYLQNGFGKTLVAPFCVRPREGAFVSVPLDWSEVKRGLDPHAFTMETVLLRVKKKDPFLAILGKGINLKNFK